MQEINELLKRMKEDDVKISYSVGTYALGLLIFKGIATVDEIVEYVKKIEKEIPDEYKTEFKSDEQLEEIRSFFTKEIAKIECVFVDSIKEYMLGVVFNDKKYVTIKAYEDIEKIKSEIEKIK